MLRNTLSVLFIAVIITACANQNYNKFSSSNNDPINLIPMYGSPKIIKTESQKKADEQFIKTVTANSGSRKKASKEFSAWGWSERRKGNIDNAMRRFNQSWMLDNDYYQPYWGFGAILLSQKKPEEASIHFEKAMQLIDDVKEKPRLFVDAARAYAWQASIEREKGNSTSYALYKKASNLIDKALTLDPEYSKGLMLGAWVYYDKGDYKNAWRIVKMARSIGKDKYSKEFINKLSNKMPEPK